MDREVAVAMDELQKINQRFGRRKSPNAPRQASEKSPFLSNQQVLEIVPVSKSTLYLMIADNEFPAPIKLGKRSAVWSKKAVNEWIAEKLGNEPHPEET